MVKDADQNEANSRNTNGRGQGWPCLGQLDGPLIWSYLVSHSEVITPKKNTRPGKRLQKTNWKDPPFLMGKSTISMTILTIAFCLFTRGEGQSYHNSQEFRTCTTFRIWKKSSSEIPQSWWTRLQPPFWLAPLLHKAQVYGRSIHCKGAHEEDLLGKCAVTGVPSSTDLGRILGNYRCIHLVWIQWDI